ncbi:MAG: hypothetical protein ACKV2T_36190 [Kofleriaceae bacterium]
MELPCPVRESFLFSADAAFVAQCTASDVELQRAAKRVFQHAGLGCDATVIVWKSAPSQIARTDRDGHTWFLEIDKNLSRDGAALGAILARQAARCVLSTRDIIRAPTPIDIELAALLLGLGPLLIAALDEHGERSLHRHASEGPLPPRAVWSLHARVCASLRISLSRTIDLPLANGGVRFAIAIAWIVARVITARRPLAFAPLDAHVVIRCFCARRLRVPTGSIGSTTCPSCKRRRGFDGRACRTTPIAETRHAA